MKNHFQVTAFLTIALTLSACQEVGLNPELSCDSCEESTTEFFQNLSRGHIRQAFAKLGEARSRDRAHWARTATETNKLLRDDGPVLGYEQLDVNQIGGRLLEYKFLLYQENNLTRWSLYYYNSEVKGWLLVNINGMPDHSQF